MELFRAPPSEYMAAILDVNEGDGFYLRELRRFWMAEFRRYGYNTTIFVLKETSE